MKKFILIISTLLTSFGAFAQDEMKADFGITRGRSIHLWPVFYREKTETDNTVRAAASLFSYKKNFLNNNLHTHLLPAYTYRLNRDQKDIRIGSLYYPSLFRYNKDSVCKIESYKGLEVLPDIDLFEYSRSPSGDYLKNNLLFFLWYKNDKVHHNSHLVIFPLYYYYQKKDESKSILFPLFSHEHNGNTNSTWAFPLFFRKHIYYGANNINEEKRFTAFPIYFRGRDSAIKTDVIFPFFWQYQKPNRHSFAFMPFYGYGENTLEHKKFYGITPLVWNINKPHFNYHFAFPVYWHKKQTIINDSIRSTVVFPFYFRKISSSSFPNWVRESSKSIFEKIDSNHFFTNNTTLFPIYWNEHSKSVFEGKTFNSNDYFAIMPFYGSGKRIRARDSSLTYYKNITPFYWQKNSLTSSSKVMFPFCWYHKDFDSVSPNNHFVFFPLYWHYRWRFEKYKNDFAYKTDVLFPFYWNKDIDENHTRTLLPLYYYKHNDVTKTYSLYAFPVYLNYKTGRSEQHFIFPIYHSYKSSFYQSKTVFPLVSFGKDTAKNNYHLAVTPLFWNINNNKKHSTFLFPVYYHSLTYLTNTQRDYFGVILYQRIKSDTAVSHHFLWPFISYEKSPINTLFMLAPLFWIDKNIAQNSWGLLPFFYKRKSATYKNYNFLWQLYSYKKRDGIYSQHNILGPLLSVTKFNNNDHDTRLAYLLFADCNVGGTVTKSLFPIYFHKHDSIGNKSTSIAFAFYNSFKRKIPSTNLFYKEQRAFWFIRLRSNAGYIKSKGIEVDRKKLKNQSL